MNSKMEDLKMVPLHTKQLVLMHSRCKVLVRCLDMKLGLMRKG